MRCQHSPVAWILCSTALVLGASAPMVAQSPLEAAKAGAWGQLASVLAAGAKVDASQPDGATALHWAAYHDAPDGVSLLLRHGAAPDVQNDYGVTALSLACENGSANVVSRLVAAGANPNLARETGETPLMTCARTGDVQAVTALLDAGADHAEGDAWYGQTALMAAAGEGHTDVAAALVARGADVRARSFRGFTALLIAARHDVPGLAQLLIEAGADVNAATPDGLTPLLVAVVRGHVDAAIALLERGAEPNHAATGYTPLHYAAGAWHTELTGNLQGIETAREAEWRFLNEVGPGRLRLVEALLAHGADPDARLEKSPPAFGFASARFRVSMLGSTPFLLAALDADVPVMRALAAAGADLSLTTNEGTTPLMVAAGLGQVPAETRVTPGQSLEAVTFLLGRNAPVNAINDRGRSALHGAAHIRSDLIVQLLFDHGAELDVVDDRGITPLMIAEGGGHILLPGLGGGSTAELLKELGSASFDPAAMIENYNEGRIR
ncbi:MAG: hypothetical protein CL483_11435 [Acidobacteria bacterium]|nr:hypothetical protein [Acidobacteriota bacterium]